VKPVPEIVADVKVRLEFPLFVIVTFWLLVWPTVTLLKLSDAGASAMMASVPVPLNETATGEFEASLVTVSVALSLPSDVGAN